MEAIEAGFVSRMNALIAQGVDFEKVVRATLLELMGETPSEVFFLGLNEGDLGDPAVIGREMVTMFGEHADTVYQSIEDRAAMSVGDSKDEKKESVESLLESIVGPGAKVSVGRTKQQKKRYLHDHRVAEDIDEYFARVSTTDGHEQAGQ